MTADNQVAFQELSQELKTEFYTSFKESMEELERCFESLNQQFDKETVNEMFRAIHSVKGNCHMMFLDQIADVCHKVEDLVAMIRKGQIEYTAQQGEFMTFIMARLEQLVAQLIGGKSVQQLDTQVLIDGVEQVSSSVDQNRSLIIQRTMQSYSGLLTSTESIANKVSERLSRQKQRSGFNELEFMGQLSERLQAKSIQKRGDIEQTVRLVLELNHMAKHPEQDEQLCAAYYLMDLGGKFISSPVFDITSESPEWERQKALEQLSLSSGFLRLGDGWADAADIIIQIHERYDGKGLNRVSAENIRTGAQILALVRFYQKAYFKYSRDHSAKISVAKSISRMNSESGYRFDPQWVVMFSEMARRDVSTLML